jgi:hypothetical protein
MNKITLTFLSVAFLASAATGSSSKPIHPTPASTAWRGKTVNAAWWGFDQTNSTPALQNAIDSGARKVIVPNLGKPWIVDPLFLASDQEIFLEKGVVIEARAGGFTGLNDCLLKADKRRHLIIRGYGATLQMHKSDYTKGEWRMALDLESCASVEVLGLTLKDSGGDGIYLGNSDPQQPYCRDILIRDCLMENHRRQGLSVISAVNLQVEHCTFRNTIGTAPQAGVDLEPNQPSEKLVNCVFRNCTMENNQGAGILIYLQRFNATTEPLSVRFDNCRVIGGKAEGIGIGSTDKFAPLGRIEFRHCRVENCEGPGLSVFTKSKDAVGLRFTKCEWRNVATDQKQKAPLLIRAFPDKTGITVGKLEFNNCQVSDDRDRPVLEVVPGGQTNRVADVQGFIQVHNTFPARLFLGDAATNITLKLKRRGAPSEFLF